MSPARWLLLLAWGASGAVHAYPFMIRHGDRQCSSCQSDPSGGTFLSSDGANEALTEAEVEPIAGRFVPLGSSTSSRSLEDPGFRCSATGPGGATSTVLLALVVALRLAASHLCRRRGRELAGDG